jgi:hypothetical protein
VIAKMDVSKPAPGNESGAVFLLPLIAKMDASASKFLFIPITYGQAAVIAKEDSIALPHRVG